MRAWIASAAAIWLALAAPVAAETELEKFQATVPPSVRSHLLDYKDCTLKIIIEKRKQSASFDDSELAIARDCRRHVQAADAALRLAGDSQASRDETIRTFARLAIAERRLLYANKQVPGFELPPFMREARQCIDDTNRVRAAAEACYIQKTRLLVARTSESAETVATAVAGSCQAARRELFQQLLKCIGVKSAEELADLEDRRMREQVISAVIQYRAAAGLR